MAANKVYPSCPKSRGSLPHLSVSLQVSHPQSWIINARPLAPETATPPRNPSPQTLPTALRRYDTMAMRWRCDDPRYRLLFVYVRLRLIPRLPCRLPKQGLSMPHTPRPDQDRQGSPSNDLLLRSRRTSRFMTRQGLQGNICAAALYANSTASPLPTAEPGITSSGTGRLSRPLSLVPCSCHVWSWYGVGFLLVWPSLFLVKTLSKEEMSRSNLNPST